MDWESFVDVMLRLAMPDDADAAVPLIYSSGPAVIEYMFRVWDAGDAMACMRRGFVKNCGELGHAIHTVAVIDGAVVGVGTAYSGREMPGYMIAGTRNIFAFYGLVRGLGVMRRALQVERLIQPPKGDMHYVAHLGVAPEMRGRGIGALLVNHLLEEGRKLGRSVAALDVSVLNPRAQALYERLGFVVTEERKSTLRNAHATVPDHRRMVLPLR
ncbi:MAG TPA: GNAT family N-acetyltransferase [Candidatus Hydrogenedentes bacterium]|nr:GNAT family N-acetyltransferase [Candidatus Hydrogenedentota bacterium]